MSEGGFGPGRAPAAADGRIRTGGDSSVFVRRTERKYAVGIASAAFLRQEIAAHLPLFEFQRGQASTYITTVYFDTSALDLYQRAQRHYEDHFKIRVKEYYYAEPGPAGAARYITGPHCYLERKALAAGTVIKKRLCLAKADLARFLAGADIWPSVASLAPAAEMETVRAVYDELKACLRTYAVQPSSAISYRRQVYQRIEGELRVTFDDEIAVYRPPAGLYEGTPALTRDVLGKTIYTSDRFIVEIKCPGDLPGWLATALQNHSSRRLSKFTTSVRLVARPLPPATGSCETGDAATAWTDLGFGERLNGDTQQVTGEFH